MAAIMANTMEAAPLSPAHDISSCCFRGAFKGVRSRAVAAGRAASVRNAATAREGSHTAAIFDGKDKSPSIKKIIICMRLVSPSKKLTSPFLFLKG